MNGVETKVLIFSLIFQDKYKFLSILIWLEQHIKLNCSAIIVDLVRFICIKFSKYKERGFYSGIKFPLNFSWHM